jgi:hypothetical protein
VSVTTEEPANETSVRPFRASFPEEAIDDLRRRIQATRLPEKETVVDLPGAAELGRAGLSKPDLLQRGGQGQPLRGLARAGALYR